MFLLVVMCADYYGLGCDCDSLVGWRSCGTQYRVTVWYKPCDHNRLGGGGEQGIRVTAKLKIAGLETSPTEVATLTMALRISDRSRIRSGTDWRAGIGG